MRSEMIVPTVQSDLIQVLTDVGRQSNVTGLTTMRAGILVRALSPAGIRTSQNTANCLSRLDHLEPQYGNVIRCWGVAAVLLELFRKHSETHGEWLAVVLTQNVQ